MDKKTIIGIVLIVLITILMPFYQKWIIGDQPPEPPSQAMKTDSIETPIQQPETQQKPIQQPAPKPTEPQKSEENEQPATTDISGAPQVKTIEVENKYFHVVLRTSGGANPVSWQLKEYKYHGDGPVNLISNNSLNLSFMNADGKEVNTNQYNFYTDFSDGQRFVLDKVNQAYRDITFYLPVANGRIVKTLRFYPDRYSVEHIVKFENLEDYIINRKYNIAWENGLPPTEQNISDDNSYARAFAYMAEELESLDADDEYKKEDYNGRADWVAIRTKYFLTAIIPADPGETRGVILGGVQKQDSIPRKYYDAAIEIDYEPRQTSVDTFSLYMGPLDYYTLDNYGVELQTLVMNKDWYERLFRPISLLIIPAFKFLYRFIPNYGFVIIIFSILIKLILHPLTKKSYQSMSEMQYLQPKMTELREKYKNEPQRLNKEMMKLYKEHGVNPMGGCLPMLLQMPLLFSLFIVFRSTIQLRGKPFILWINDLSAPDVLHLGFSLPFIGDNIHVLPILMGVTMIWQSKMSMTDPKQKLMIYFMPVFMVFIFYSLPSGLNLYYAIFNLLSMLQTRAIKKKMHPEGEPAPAVQPAKSSNNKQKRGRKS